MTIKLFSLSLSLSLSTINEFSSSYYNIYSTWNSWIYRDNAYLIQPKFCQMIINETIVTALPLCHRNCPYEFNTSIYIRLKIASLNRCYSAVYRFNKSHYIPQYDSSTDYPRTGFISHFHWQKPHDFCLAKAHALVQKSFQNELLVNILGPM